MKILAVLVLMSLLNGQAQRVQDVPAPDREAVQAVISAQIEAFRKDDAATAYSFAAPGIKQAFTSPQVFLAMVRQGYAQIYRPLQYTFGPVTRSTGALAQISQVVNLVGLDGKRAVAFYLLERQPDGSWKIAGVQIEVIATGPST